MKALSSRPPLLAHPPFGTRLDAASFYEALPKSRGGRIYEKSPSFADLLLDDYLVRKVLEVIQFRWKFH